MRADRLTRERWRILLWAIPAGALALLVAQAAGPFSDRPWATLALLVPLAIAIFTLGRPLWRERRIVMGGGFMLFFLAYFAFFTIAAGTRLLDGRRALIAGYEDAVPSNFLGLNWLGDWRYLVAPEAPPAVDFAVITVPSFEGRELIETRRELAALIRIALDEEARGIAFDYFFEGPSDADAILCFWIGRARDAGMPVLLGYRLVQQDGAMVRPQLPPVLRECVRDDELASLMGVLEADQRIRMVLASRPDDPAAPSLARRVATLVAGDAVRVPRDGLIQFVPPSTGPVQVAAPIDAEERPLLRDRFLFAGALRQGDIRDTPFGRTPGVMLHAYAAHSLRTGEFIVRLPLAGTLAILFVLCWVLTLVQARGGGPAALVQAALIEVAALSAGAALAMRAGLLWVDVAYPFAAAGGLTMLLAAGAAVQRGRLGARPAVPRTAPVDSAGPVTVTAPFDVFISYNGQEREAVLRVAEALRDRGLRVWLDVWELVPGRPWQEAVEEIIRTTRSAAIVVGPSGLGPWEIPEMRACLEQCVRRRLPVIPVLLPGSPQRPELPLFLSGFTWVDLRAGLDPNGLDRLEWGITGIKPESRRAA